jgi:hypothetical protein
MGMDFFLPAPLKYRDETALGILNILFTKL